jgi:hypothetical protein
MEPRACGYLKEAIVMLYKVFHVVSVPDIGNIHYIGAKEEGTEHGPNE